MFGISFMTEVNQVFQKIFHSMKNCFMNFYAEYEKFVKISDCKAFSR